MQILRQVLGLPRGDYRTDNRLRELDYGEFQTFTWEELQQSRPADVLARKDDSWNFVVPGGESYAMLAERLFDWLSERQNDTVVTAHAGISRILRGHFTNYPPRDTAFLDAPQDQILIIRNGETIEWV
jgi:probable phosphoglycerate mutase